MKVAKLLTKYECVFSKSDDDIGRNIYGYTQKYQLGTHRQSNNRPEEPLSI